MAKDDYYVIVYKVLIYLYAVLKRKKVFDESEFKMIILKGRINEDYFISILELMQEDELITGLNFKKVWGNEVILVNDISDMKMSKTSFYKYISDNDYEKVGPGIYVAPSNIADNLYIIHKRCPNCVISHDEALYYYGLIDREPSQTTITVYSGYNATRLRKTGYKVYYVNKDLLEIGKTETVDNFGNTIPIYNLERTIVDLIRSRRDYEIQDSS